jgi:hypothetical protein
MLNSFAFLQMLFVILHYSAIYGPLFINVLVFHSINSFFTILNIAIFAPIEAFCDMDLHDRTQRYVFLYTVLYEV